MSLKSLIGLKPDELTAALVEAGVEPKAARMRTRQLWNWIYVHGAKDFAAMSNLAKDFRKLLEKYARQEAIMVVGHNPNLSQFLGALISDAGCEASLELKKGAVAKVEMRRASGTLQWCVTPKVLRALYDTAVESSRPNTSRK